MWLWLEYISVPLMVLIVPCMDWTFLTVTCLCIRTTAKQVEILFLLSPPLLQKLFPIKNKFDSLVIQCNLCFYLVFIHIHSESQCMYIHAFADFDITASTIIMWYVSSVQVRRCPRRGCSSVHSSVRL